jgi:sugar lactone lactonase YvrE
MTLEPTPHTQAIAANRDEKNRRWLLIILILLSLLFCAVSYLFLRYLRKPEPLPEMIPLVEELDYPPHYLFSIYGLDKPVGVSISPDGERIFASETGGERLIKAFDRDGGEMLFAFAPPRTRPGERSPVYMAVDSANRLFVSDRLQHTIFVYDLDGNFIDSILAPDMTLSEYLAAHIGNLPEESRFSFNTFESDIYYQKPGEEEQLLPAPEFSYWSPLGIFFQPNGEMLLTDVAKDANFVRQLSADIMSLTSWQSFDPPEVSFGTEGQGNGEFLFPNVAVTDSQERVYVSDGNNGRISVWSADFEFLFNFGRGTSDGALNLPRGMAIDDSDRLYIVDAVGQNVKVYDVSGDQPRFLFDFGNLGLGDGQFQYPNDIVVDSSGRLYIADRENNRIQVWSY